MKAKRLEQMWYNADQSWFYEAFYEMGDAKLKIKIRRNAYDFQSYARCEALDRQERKWNLLVSVPYPKMKACGSYVTNDLSPEEMQSFLTDADELLKLAGKVLT